MIKRNLWATLLWLMGVALIASAVPAVTQAQAPAEDYNRIRQQGRIVFGTSGDYPPFESYNSNFQLDGFDIALAKELGKRLGVEVEFNDFAFNGLLDALQLGQFDAAISAMSVTADRQQRVDFTNLYYIDDDAVLTMASNPLRIRSATDFAGLRVGVETGTTYHHWAQENLVATGIIAQDALLNYPDTGFMLRALRTDEVDATIMGRLPAFVYNMSFDDIHLAGRGLNQQRLGIAVRKGSNLVDPLNQALLAIQADGTYAALVSQYLNLDKDEVIHDPGLAAVDNAPAEPEPVPACIYGMAYVADLNLDDRNMTAPPVMTPGQGFTKSWRVRNSGTCAWDADFMLLYVNGNRGEAGMGSQPQAVGRSVAPGETVDLSMPLTAPNAYGTFQAFFQMRDSTGKLFGEVIWAGIQVPDPNPPPTPTPVPAPPAANQMNPNLRADSTWVNPGQCTTLRWDIDGISAIYLVDGNNVQGVGGHDSRTVCLGQTWTYVLRVVRTDGVTVEFPITINVNGSSQPSQPSRPGPSISRLSVDHNEIRAGECVRLEWRTDNADGVNLYRGGNRIVSNGPREGSHSDCPPTGHNDYDLEAYGNGNTSQRITVNVDGGRHRDE